MLLSLPHSREIREHHAPALGVIEGKDNRMDHFTITITTTGAAFRYPDADEDAPAQDYAACEEIARILRVLEGRIGNGATAGNISDANGNNVGRFDSD